MKYINKEVSIYRHPTYVGCEPVARATWWNVLCLCCEIENNGRVIGARTWGDRRWQQTAAVMLSEVNASAPLLVWEGQDLIVWGYPTEKQEFVEWQRKGGSARSEAKTEAARINGQKGGRPAKNNPPETQATTHAETQGNPTETQNPKSKPNVGGREGGRDRGREGEIDPPVSPKGEADGRKPSSLDPVIAYFADHAEAASFFDHYSANGWKQGGRSALVSWQSAARKWIRNWETGGRGARKNSSGGSPARPAAPFNPANPHAHTGGLPVVN
jgi:hypothetical protein